VVVKNCRLLAICSTHSVLQSINQRIHQLNRSSQKKLLLSKTQQLKRIT